MKPACLNRLVQTFKTHLLYVSTSLKKTSEVVLKESAFSFSEDESILDAIRETANSSC